MNPNPSYKDSFFGKYVFTTDHKIISKQFMFTAMFMATTGAILSVLFRLQLAWPAHHFLILHYFLRDRWAPHGILDPNMYLGLVTIHGTIMMILFCKSYPSKKENPMQAIKMY